MSYSLNHDGSFTGRPPIGASFLAPNGERVVIAASWQYGVVFEGGACCTARNFLNHYAPLDKEIDHVPV